MEALLQAESVLLLFIQDHLRHDWLNPIMVFITSLGNSGFIWILLGVCLLLPKKTRRGGAVLLLCLLGAWLLNDYVIKPLVARPRPYTTIPGLTALVQEASFSFPSGHTNCGFACALALTMYFGKAGAWTYVFAAIIALSRCYVGVHYPTDILGGMIVGTLSAWLVYRLLQKLRLAPPSGKTP